MGVHGDTGAGAGASADQGIGNDRAPKEDPALESKEKLAEALTKGLPIFAAVLSTVAAFKGGIARVVVNEGPLMLAAVIVFLLGFGASVGAWWSVRNRPAAFTRCIFLALASTLIACTIAVVASVRAVERYDRPTLTASWKGDSIEFTAEMNLLRAVESMTVTVHGYPLRWDEVKVVGDQKGVDRGSELFRSTTGPDPEGTARSAGSIAIDRNAYEIIELRVSKTGEEARCFIENIARAGCIQVWTRPRPPVLRPPA